MTKRGAWMKRPCTNGQLVFRSALFFFAPLQRSPCGSRRSCRKTRRAEDIPGNGFGGSVFAKAVRAKYGGSGLAFRGFGGDEGAFLLANKGQFLVLAVPIDAHEVADAHLLRRKQVSQRIDDVALDGALQMARTVALVRAFLQEEVAAGISDAKEEFAVGGVQDALLDHAELDVEHLLELLALQRVENDQLVQSVHEFGGKLAARRFDSGALDLLVEVGL